MKKNIFLTAAAVTFAISASAQNLNPTVEVTNDFLTRSVDASKPMGKMEVPDSVMKFDLDFDYSVLSNPYKGGYDFAPYLLEMKPGGDGNKGGKFYLRAGAGYTLNPEFDLVWSPRLKNQALHLNVYAKNRSYVGDYMQIHPEVRMSEDGTAVESYDFVPFSPESVDDEYASIYPTRNSGYDIHTTAGVNGKYDFARSFLDFALSYEGIHHKNFITDYNSGSCFSALMRGNYNAVEAKAGLHSTDDGNRTFKYDADLSYRYSLSDELGFDEWLRGVASNDVALKAELGPVLNETHAVLVGVGMFVSAYTAPLSYRIWIDRPTEELMHSQAGHLYVAPHYVLSSYRMKLSAGLKLDMAVASKNEFIGGLPINQNKGQLIYPDVRFDYQLIREHLDAYASVTGGVDHNPYTSLIQNDHFYQAISNSAFLNPVSMNTIERFNARLGLRGNIASVFRYDISGGYASYDGYRHSVVGYDASTLGNSWYVDHRPVLKAGTGTFYGYDAAKVAYAELKAALELGSFLMDGDLIYTHTNLLKNAVPGFSPSPLVGNISVSYNWKDRIMAGVHADGAVRREGVWGYSVDYNPALVSIWTGHASMPGFLNLGFDASYAFNRKLSFWLKGDNLLCQTIQRTPLYAEKGIKFTAGICLNL
ncbi:MAG: hypothetical protein MJY88_02375 [Bacteroidales bacterium]|nr:hypothetical protein [Bacteroidales bacterium]